MQEQPISVLFRLPETDLPAVREAMTKGTLPMLANTADDRKTLGRGMLTTVDNAVDSSSGTIDTVDGVRAKLPQLLKSIPPEMKVEVVSDRTQTIRASVSDVEFTLMLSVALVVGVIFVFLRSAWATVIPSVTIRWRSWARWA